MCACNKRHVHMLESMLPGKNAAATCTESLPQVLAPLWLGQTHARQYAMFSSDTSQRTLTVWMLLNPTGHHLLTPCAGEATRGANGHATGRRPGPPNLHSCSMSADRNSVHMGPPERAAEYCKGGHAASQWGRHCHPTHCRWPFHATAATQVVHTVDGDKDFGVALLQNFPVCRRKRAPVLKPRSALSAI